jgi:hypothetical protein
VRERRTGLEQLQQIRSEPCRVTLSHLLHTKTNQISNRKKMEKEKRDRVR